MSEQSQYDNSGALFRNEDKDNGGSSNWPDYKGSATIDGVQYWMSAWIKEGRNGKKKFMSIAFKPKEQRYAQENGRAQSADPNDEIPF